MVDKPVNTLPPVQAYRKIEQVEAGQLVYELGKPLIDKTTGVRGLVKVKEIGEHDSRGPGDLWFYDVLFDDGSIHRVFNMTRVQLSKPMTLVTPPKPGLIT